MVDIVTDAKDILVAAAVGQEAGLATEADWDIFAGKYPAEPNSLISINDTPGLPPNPKWLVDFPSIQIRVRGPKEDYPAARAKAEEVKDAMLGLPSQDINGNRWTAVNMIGDIAPLGQDDLNRWQFTVNFALIIEPNSGTHRDSL